MPKRAKAFFEQAPRLEDDLTREQEVAALLGARRSIVQDLPVERIHPNPFQARRNFEGLDELVQAMHTQGFTSRLRVRPDPTHPDHFQLVYGERRLRAAKQAGLSTVPCEIAEHSDAELLEIGLAENIQRKDLDPLEEAQAFKLCIEQRGYTIRSLAERIGKDKSYVMNRLGLLSRPPEVQEMVQARPDTLVTAQEVSRLPNEQVRRDLAQRVVSEKLPVKVVRAEVKRLTQPILSLRRDKTESATSEDPIVLSLRRDKTPVNVLASDLQTLRALCDHWRTLAPALSGAERDHLRTALDEALTHLETLRQTLIAEQLHAEIIHLKS